MLKRGDISQDNDMQWLTSVCVRVVLFAHHPAALCQRMDPYEKEPSRLHLSAQDEKKASDLFYAFLVALRRRLATTSFTLYDVVILLKKHWPFTEDRRAIHVDLYDCPADVYAHMVPLSLLF